MNIGLLIATWFLVPWLILAAKVVRVSLYEMRFGLLMDLPLFGFGEVMKRIKERRRVDPIYDRMKGDAIRWGMITAYWWVGSFAALVGGAVIYGFSKR